MHTQLSKAEEAGDKAAIIELSRRIVAIAPNDSDAWETLAQTQLDIEDLDRLAQTLDAAYADMAKANKIDASDSFPMLSQFANDE